VLSKLITQLSARKNLSGEEISSAIIELTSDTVPPQTKAAFLSALAQKGETPDEIAAFAAELRKLAIQPPIDAELRAQDILDVVGTGGDRLGTFNISTAAALIAAAAGVKVAKHGNRAVTSLAGSADVLEALGIPTELPPAEAVESLRRHNFAFFFAPLYHPAFKSIAPARKLCADRGQRTVFNFLGPLLNPANVSVQLLGVSRPGLCAPLARVLQNLGLRRAMVVCGEVPQLSPPEGSTTLTVCMDELSTLGENVVAEFYQSQALSINRWMPSGFPIQPVKPEDLVGGDKHVNADIIRRLFRGEDRGPKRDALLLNAGAALWIAGKASSITDGWNMAARIIDDGAADAKLRELARAA